LFVLINSLTLESNICFCATELADNLEVKVSLDWLMEQPAYSKKNYYGMSRWHSWGHTLFSLQQEKLNNHSDPYTFLYREIPSAMNKGQYAHTLLEFDSVLVQLKYDVKTTERVPLPGWEHVPRNFLTELHMHNLTKTTQYRFSVPTVAAEWARVSNIFEGFQNRGVLLTGYLLYDPWELQSKPLYITNYDIADFFNFTNEELTEFAKLIKNGQTFRDLEEEGKTFKDLVREEKLCDCKPFTDALTNFRNPVNGSGDHFCLIESHMLTDGSKR